MAMKLQKTITSTAIAICLMVSMSCLQAKKLAITADSPIMVYLGMLAALFPTPEFNPAPGTFTTTQTIEIKHRNRVPVRYTLDGTTTPSCTVGEVYDETNKFSLSLGKYTLQAVECFEGLSSSVAKGDYNITGTFGYSGLVAGSLVYNSTYTPTGLDATGVYLFSVAPALPTCITLNQNTGVLIANCSTTQINTFRITASRQNGNRGDLLLNLNVNIVQFENQAYIKAPNAEGVFPNGDNFGNSVSISSDTIVVGANLEDSLQTTITNVTLVQANDVGVTNSGAAYVFRRTGNTWANEAYLKAPNAEITDNFGQSVSISGDTIVVGAWQEDSNQTTITNGTTASADNTAGNSGAAYVFRRTNGLWAQEAYLKAANAGSGDVLGQTLSISGETIVVSAQQESSNQTTITNGTTASADNSLSGSGAAYVFRRTGTIWAQEAYLKAPNPDVNDNFGRRWIAISGETIVVPSWNEDSNQTTITNGTTASADNSLSNSGAVYVFQRTGTTWAQQAYLKAPNADVNDQFGRAVAISGDTIVVGANQESSNQTTITNGTTASADNTLSNSGAGYVFQRTGTTWAQQAYLKASNAKAGNNFGDSVAIEGDTILVGAPNENSNQTTITNGNTASADFSMTGAGAVYAFRRIGTTWTQVAYIKSPNADPNDNFGTSLSISGDTIVVGAGNEDSAQTTITNGSTAALDNTPNLTANQGAAYVFRLR